jgi:predicted TIM-barrel fold metal-dependent hydrolase
MTEEFIVDADAHNLPLPADVAPYLPQRWRRYMETYGLRTAAGESGIPRARFMGSRTDAWTPEGRPPGSDPAFFTEQLLDRYGIDAAILNNVVMSAQMWIGGNQPLELTEAYMAACNDHTAEHWLGADERYYSCICTAYEDPPAAVREIERWGDHPRFVHLGLPFSTQNPLGHRKYWPFIEAAVAYDLPLAIHPGGGSNAPVSGVGWPSFYLEEHCGRPQAVVGQIASLICEGTFDRFPGLKIVIVEGGYSWIRPFLWRLERSWRQLRDEVSHLQRSPTEYLDEHFWFTSQPIEEPDEPGQLVESLEIFGLTDRLMYSSDYPHWDFDAPDKALPGGLPPDLRRGIMGLNATRLYPTLPVPA